MGLKYGKYYLVETEVEDLGYQDASLLTDKLQENHDPYHVEFIVMLIKTVLLVNVHNQDGQPMENLTVKVMKWNDLDQFFETHKEGETNKEGKFRCLPSIAGPALVEIHDEELQHCLARHYVNIIEDNETQLVSMIPSGKVIQGIMRRHDGRPAKDFRVYLFSKDPITGAPDDWLARLKSKRVGKGYPDEEGRFLIKNLSFELFDLYFTQIFL